MRLRNLRGWEGNHGYVEEAGASRIECVLSILTTCLRDGMHSEYPEVGTCINMTAGATPQMQAGAKSWQFCLLGFPIPTDLVIRAHRCLTTVSLLVSLLHSPLSSPTVGTGCSHCLECPARYLHGYLPASLRLGSNVTSVRPVLITPFKTAVKHL